MSWCPMGCSSSRSDPLFFSEHGSYLRPWFDQSFPHWRLDDPAVRLQVRQRIGSVESSAAMLDLYDTCNHLALDQLGAALVEASFFVSSVCTSATSAHVPPSSMGCPLSLLTKDEVKFLAVRR